MIVFRNKYPRSHAELVDLAEKWLIRKCGFAFKELATLSMEIPDAIGFRYDVSVMIECKTTFADFKQDFKKRFRIHSEEGVGKFRYYLCENGIIQLTDLPPKWGLLWVSEKGRIIVKKGPKGNTWSDQNFIFKRNRVAEASLMYSALRRLHLQGAMPLIYERFRKVG